MGSYNEDTGLRDENLHLNDCQHAVTLATKPASYYKISISNLGARLRCGVFRCCAVVAAGLSSVWIGLFSTHLLEMSGFLASSAVDVFRMVAAIESVFDGPAPEALWFVA